MKQLYKLLSLLFVVVFSLTGSNYCFGQAMGINATGASPDPSAILDLASTTKGMLAPRMDSFARNAISSPAQSLLIFDNSTNSFEMYYGTKWQKVATMCSSAPSTPATPTGSTSVCSGQIGVIYSVPLVSGATSYAWALPSGATIISGRGTDTISVTFGSTAGNISVTASNNCGSSPSSALTVSMTASVGGSISGSTTVCAGSNSGTLTLSGYTGSIAKWQSSTTSDFSANITDIANTTTTLNFSNLSATTYYRTVVSSGTCVSANSSTASVTVNAASAGGSIAGSTSVCSGTNSGTLTLSGYTGSITKWQYSTASDFSSGPTDVSNTTTTLNFSNLSATTYYRAVITSGVCGAANSTLASVTINTAPSITVDAAPSSQSVCPNATPTNLSVTATGTGLAYQWYNNGTTNSNSGGTVVGAGSGGASNPFTPVTSPAGTVYYYCVVSGTCASVATSSAVAITVLSANPSITAGPTPTTQNACTSGSATALSITATGTSISYQWYSNASNSNTGGTSVGSGSGGQTSSYTPAVPSGTTYYYCVVSSNGCSGIASSVVTVNVYTSNACQTCSGAGVVSYQTQNAQPSGCNGCSWCDGSGHCLACAWIYSTYYNNQRVYTGNGGSTCQPSISGQGGTNPTNSGVVGTCNHIYNGITGGSGCYGFTCVCQ